MTEQFEGNRNGLKKARAVKRRGGRGEGAAIEGSTLKAKIYVDMDIFRSNSMTEAA
jgi:hypothetical protein